jgi:uncharacterized protein YggU (UPF0235/DUF167 family)
MEEKPKGLINYLAQLLQIPKKTVKLLKANQARHKLMKSAE